MRKSWIFLLTGILFAGCFVSDEVSYDLPYEFRHPEKKLEFIKDCSENLEGEKIFIDPGHGGEDRRSISPNGMVVEADVNLQVALSLREYLEDAGAIVEMSRETDKTVPLKDRSVLANRSGAEIFISIHHNAPGSDENIWTNYTSTYYHATKADYEYEPCNQDLARYIQRDLSYAMRNPGGLGSFDGTYSDYWIYPGDGFSVLRLTDIPAVLVECGFFTHHYEEKLLADIEFNKVEAWGIFKGICKYFAAGVPTIAFSNEDKVFTEGDIDIKFHLEDKFGIDPSTISVQFDSVYVPEFIFEDKTGTLDVPVVDVQEGTHVVRVIAANLNGNHAFPFHKEIMVLKQ